MKITIINNERNEKRYTREELDEFVAQLKDGTYRQHYVRDYNKEVCFAAEWMKQSGELKAKSLNALVLLSLENLRDMATVQEYKRLATQQPYTLLCFIGHDGHSLHIVCPYAIAETTNTQHPSPNTHHPTPNTHHPTPNPSSMPSASCTISTPRSWVHRWQSMSLPS